MEQNDYDIESEQELPSLSRTWELMMKAIQMEIPDMFGDNSMTPEEIKIANEKREVKIVVVDHSIRCKKCGHHNQDHTKRWNVGKVNESPYYSYHCAGLCKCKQYVGGKKETIKVCEDGIKI